MFGLKHDNQTTVGEPTVQNPSMLDNVSSQDFDAPGADGNVQKQVEDALNQHEMKKMMDSATASPPKTASGAFMSSPSATPSAAVDGGAAAQSPAPMPAGPPIPHPITDDASSSTPPTDPVPGVASGSGSCENDPVETAPAESEVPRPLSPAENSEIEAAPTANTPRKTEADPDGSAAQSSPSAPIEPPAPPEGVAMPAIQSVSAAVSDDDDNTADTEDSDEVSGVGSESSVEENEAEKPSEQQQEPTADDTAEPNSSEIDDAVSDSPPEEPSEPKETATVSAVPAVDHEKLAGMKQHALEHLDAVADKLDQSPEEEFKTTMMRIQANDNHTLLEKALNAAKNIEDGSKRAKAMLDIINEINYFSQSADSVDDSPDPDETSL